MDIIFNSNFDICLVVTNKTENHRGYIELLYESEKRTGGGEINNLIYDATLKQFIIVFKNPKIEDVLAFGDVNFQNELYQSFKIDRKRFIIENIDSCLQNDIINLYIDYLLEDTENSEFKIEHLRTGYVLIECNEAIDFDSLKKKYSNHCTLQNKTIKFHFIPDLDKNLNALNKIDKVNYFSNILNSSELFSINNEARTVGYTENSPMQESLSASEIFSKEKIKSLEHKLLLYKSLNESLNQVNFLDNRVSDWNNNATSSLYSADNNIPSPLDSRNPIELKTLCQDNNVNVSNFTDLNLNKTQNRCDKAKLIKSFQKFLVDDKKSEADEKKTSKAKNWNKTSLSKSQCTFSPLKFKCNTLAQRFPVIKYQRPKCKSYFKPEEETGENFDLDTCLNLNIKCSICLEDLLPNDSVKILSCFHQFHVKCIDTWLAQKSTCPTCKLDLTNTSG